MSDETASMAAINAIRALSKRVGIPEGFSQLGVSKADIEGWLDKALADPCAPCNPRSASRDEVRELYRRRYDPQSIRDAGQSRRPRGVSAPS